MIHKMNFPLLTLAAIAALALSACGGGSSDASSGSTPVTVDPTVAALGNLLPADAAASTTTGTPATLPASLLPPDAAAALDASLLPPS